MLEHEMIYPITCEVMHFNEHGGFKLSSYQSLFASIAEQHLNRHHLNVQTTMKTGYAWVLIGLTVDVVKPILEPMKLFAQTWHSLREGIYFRREFVFKDEEGNTRFQGASFSVLIHLQKRTIFKDSQLPFEIPLTPHPVFQVNTTPRLTPILGLQPVYQTTIPASFIDRLGHVNNVRYGDLAYDAMTQEQQARLHRLKRMQMNFSSELNRGDRVSFHQGDFQGLLYIRGYDEEKLKASFDVKIEWN